MARATSFNWELHISENATDVIYPSSLGEFGEGEEGRLDVADGDRKYKIRDQIYDIGEVECTILIKDDFRELTLMDRWASSGLSRPVWLVAKGAGKDNVGSGRVTTMTYLLTNCQCAMGKKNAFDRQSKTHESKKYFLIPEEIELVTTHFNDAQALT